MSPWQNPFEELRHTVRRLIWAVVIVCTLISIIAVSGVSLAWYGLRKQVQENERILIAMCRQNNAQNKDLRTVLLTFGVQPHELFELRPIVCSQGNLKERFDR